MPGYGSQVLPGGWMSNWPQSRLWLGLVTSWGGARES